MMQFRAAIVTVALVFTALTVSGAHSQTPRDSVPGLRGTVSGRVDIEEDEQHAPIRRAAVTLRDSATGQVLTAATDSDGRYRFDDVPSGDYKVLAQKPGFLSAPADVHTRGELTRNLTMRRAGAVEGRFVDSHGDPVDRLTVFAELVSAGPAVAAAADRFSALTDDLGRFRIHTLPPGRYRVYATPPPPASGEKLFYPGTASTAEATSIQIVNGQTVDGLEFTVPSAPLSAIAAEALANFDRDSTSSSTVPTPGGRLSGRITRNDTGQAVANAKAQLASVAGAPVSIIRAATTDGNGRYEFKELARGEYTLTVSAAGFLNIDASLQRPEGAGTRVAIKDGEQNDRVDVAMARTSAIEAVILDEFGDPAPGVMCQVTVRTQLGSLQVFPVGLGRFATTGPTDDRGWFRSSGLFPGDYYLLALPEPFERSGPAAFATTFFPGTTSADTAGAVHLVAGMDAHDVSFKLVAAGASTVSGMVADAAGVPLPKSQVLLIPTDNGEIRAMVIARTSASADGSFSYRDVPDGTYVLQGMGDGLFGSSLITVRSADRTPRPVSLTLRPLTTARGRVSFEGDAAPRPAIGAVTIGFQPTDFTRGPAGSNRIASEIAADWSFEIPNLAWYGILRVIAPAGWALARIQLDGRDITDTPYDFQSADVRGLEVVLTNRLGTVTGTVLRGGQPAAGATVVLFGADSSAVMYVQRTSRSARTNDQGGFTLTGVVPGRYYAVAIPPSGQPNQQSLLTLRSVATPIVVSDRANAPLALTVIK